MVDIQFENMMETGTFREYLQEYRCRLEDDVALPMSEMVDFEKQAIEMWVR